VEGGALKGRLALADHVVQAAVDDPPADLPDQGAAEVADGLLLLDRPHADDAHVAARDLGVGDHRRARLRVGHDAEGGIGGRVGDRPPVGEGGLHHRLGLVQVDVADDHQHAVVGAVPPSVVADQLLARGAAHDVRKADRQPLRHPRSGKDGGEQLLEHPLARPLARVHLLQDDAALLLDALRQQAQAEGEVRHAQQALLHGLGVRVRQRKHERGLVEAREGVLVVAEGQADRFEVLHQLARREVLAAFEGHVLEEVRQPALVVILVDRSAAHVQPDAHALRRRLVRAQPAPEAVRERDDPHVRIDGQRGAQVEPGRLHRHRVHCECEQDGCQYACKAPSPPHRSLPQVRFRACLPKQDRPHSPEDQSTTDGGRSKRATCPA
jgi:hypothetical protein